MTTRSQFVENERNYYVSPTNPTPAVDLGEFNCSEN